MTFCTQCQTYLAPGDAACPACNTPRPPAAPITALWTTALDALPVGPPLAAGDLLLVPTQPASPAAAPSALHAFDLHAGNLRWSKTFPHALVSGLQTCQVSPALPARASVQTWQVLVSLSSADLLHGQGALLALDENGAERWRWMPGARRVSAPAIACSNDLSRSSIYFTADAHTLVTLDLASGDELARAELPASASLAAPAVDAGMLFVPCRQPRLLAVDLDGAPLWTFDAAQIPPPSSVLRPSPDAWLDQTPVIVGEHIYAVLSSGAALALHARDGKLAWCANVGPQGKRLSPPASDGQRLFVGARDGLYALNLADGGQAWHFPTPRRVQAAPVVLGGVVYAACCDHQLYALDAATGQELWSYPVARRVELPPVLTPLPQACAILADQGGTLTAIARPPGAVELEAAGRWVEAASVHAARGQLRRAAELLESHSEPFKAAQLWQAEGKTQRAAEQYQVAGRWRRAAELWGDLGRSLQRAEALEQHARSLDGEPHNDQERAAAWAAAAEALRTEGVEQRAADCQRQVCRYRRLPSITLDVEHQGLVMEKWSLLQLAIRNQGFGPARNLVIRARSDRQFEGQVAGTQRIVVLRAGDERTDALDVRPLQYGDHVPLRLAVEYRDPGGDHSFERTIHILVARDEADQATSQVFHIDTGGGAAVVGGVSVSGGGDFIGRDQSTGAEQQPASLAPRPSPSAALRGLASPLATQLCRILSDRLDLDEFKILCSELGVNYDHLDGQNLRAKSLSLVQHLQKRDALSHLVKWLNQNRPDIEIGN